LAIGGDRGEDHLGQVSHDDALDVDRIATLLIAGDFRGGSRRGDRGLVGQRFYRLAAVCQPVPLRVRRDAPSDAGAGFASKLGNQVAMCQIADQNCLCSPTSPYLPPSVVVN